MSRATGGGNPGERTDLAAEIVVAGLAKSYPVPWQKGNGALPALQVLRGVDFTVRAGERVAIVGASGAGKSTLLHLVGTLDRPTSGRISIGGQDVERWPGPRLARFRNETLGFIFQFHHLLPDFSALENVMMPAVIAGRGRREAEALAREGLDAVGLADRAEHRPGELSGGERQRVAVARAIVLRPPILLADEPTGNLDAKTGGAIHELLARINEERRVSLVTVTHNPELARRMHRQIRLVEGRAVEESPGTAMEIPMEAQRP